MNRNLVFIFALIFVSVGGAAETQFIRLVKSPNDELKSLDCAITTYANKDISVDLISAIHIGDKAYYDALNTKFKNYEVVLYELVAQKGQIPVNEPESTSVSLTSIGKGVLGLEHQLTCIDYTAKNFVHADLSFDELQKKMAERGDTAITLVGEAIIQQMRESNKQAAKPASEEGDFDLLADVLLSIATGKPSIALKENMARQLGEQIDAQMGGNLGKLIIDDRNSACLEVLRTEVNAGKKKIAIFYGAGHYSAMEPILTKDFQLDKVSQSWVQAWKLD